jgi:hypothetical protein
MDIADTRLRSLVACNVIVAAVVAITFIGSAAQESFVFTLGSLVGVLVLVGLGVASIIAAFHHWKRYRRWALVPLASFIACTAAMVTGVRFVNSLVLSGTPMRPDTFPRGEVKADLEHIAAQLLGHSFKSISTRPDATAPVHMVAGIGPETISANLLRRLNAYGFDAVFVDDAQSLVVYSSYRYRVWRDYLYARTGALAPAYSRQSTITRVDIEDWEELPRMARQGPNMTVDAQGRICFAPTVVYPALRQALGQDQLDAIAKSDASTITPEQKALVLKALNDQRLATSRLVEDTCVTLSETQRFRLSVGCPISDEFWVSKLVQTLLRNGILQKAEDNRHLRIKRNLTELEQRQVEWVHIGLMNFLYGNLLEKRDLNYSKDLGNGWYFGFD